MRGNTTLTFVGGGYESRQAIRRKVHEHLGTWQGLQDAVRGANDDGQAQAA